MNLEPIHPHPLVNYTEVLSWRGKLRFLFPGIILIPIRGALFISSFLTLYCLSKLVLLGTPKNHSSSNTILRPFNGWRAFVVRHVMNRLHRVILFAVGFHWIRIKGKIPSLQDMPRIVVCNHMSPWEGEALTWLTGAAWLTRRENATTPLAGEILRASHHVTVDRDENGAVRNAKLCHEAIEEFVADKRYPPLGIFPEGTCSNGSVLLRFRIGAFKPGVPILPVIARFKYQDYNDPSMVGVEVDLIPLIIRMLSVWYSSMELEFLPIYTPTGEEKMSPTLYRDNVRALMSKHLRVPLTEHNHEDNFLQEHAKVNKIHSHTVVLGMGRVRHVLPMKEVARLMKVYAELVHKTSNGDRWEGIRYETFASYFDCHNKDVFHKFCKDRREHFRIKSFGADSSHSNSNNHHQAPMMMYFRDFVRAYAHFFKAKGSDF
eukprot:PhF_6_TR4822/c0_g1_i1/m.6675/K13510/LPCAT1_2; lysophosphatidylcholine acyltransferase / lyso-PAF acetyltransferase